LSKKDYVIDIVIISRSLIKTNNLTVNMPSQIP
jgi:hypothetical protein